MSVAPGKGTGPMKRTKRTVGAVSPPGTPSGYHSPAMAKDGACRCGRCVNEAKA